MVAAQRVSALTLTCHVLRQEANKAKHKLAVRSSEYAELQQLSKKVARLEAENRLKDETLCNLKVCAVYCAASPTVLTVCAACWCHTEVLRQVC